MASNIPNTSQAQLFHIHDPMCSWCWGFKPTLEALKQKLPATVDFVNIVGGLAPDSTEPMPQEMQQFLQATWQKISSQLGTEFNHNFWTENTPIRNTYQACRSVLIAKEYDKEQQMIDTIQQGYYLNAKNPSDSMHLADFAEQIGIDRADFLARLQSSEIEQALQQDIAMSRQLQAQGFPSLRVVRDNQLHAIALDYQNADTMLAEILQIIE